MQTSPTTCFSNQDYINLPTNTILHPEIEMFETEKPPCKTDIILLLMPNIHNQSINKKHLNSSIINNIPLTCYNENTSY